MGKTKFDKQLKAEEQEHKRKTTAQNNEIYKLELKINNLKSQIETLTEKRKDSQIVETPQSTAQKQRSDSLNSSKKTSSTRFKLQQLSSKSKVEKKQ